MPETQGSGPLLELTSRYMYQHPAGSAAAPIAGVVAAFSDLAFDTFAAQGFAATDGSASAQAILEPTSLLMALIATLTLLRSPWTRNSATH